MLTVAPLWLTQMKNNQEIKTNVMRILGASGIRYAHFSYDSDKYNTGAEIAAALSQNPAAVFKTLVTIARPGKYYVFMVPVCSELDLKHASIAVGEKSLAMLPQRELLGLTGYVHGGCSPIGMKKHFPTIIDTSAQNFDTIIFSAGARGHQVEILVTDLQKLVNLRFADIVSH